MIIRSILYVFKQSLINLWRNRTMTVASIVSVSATLLILGVIFILIVNISNFSEYASDQFDVVQVFLDDGQSNEDMKAIGDKILEIQEVSNVTFESKTQALEKMKEDWESYSSVLSGLEERNPLPNSYIVNIDNLIYSDSIVRRINEIDGIELVKYYKDVIDTINSMTSLIRNMGLGIIVVLLFVSTFVISNTIKLAVTARKSEIQIMKYVGATSGFIRWPFILEGTILGLVGASIAGFIIYVGYSATYDYLTGTFFQLVGASIVPVAGVMSDLLQVFLPVGIGIGALGSLWGVRKYLNV